MELMEHISNENCKSYLADEEQKAMFLVLYRSDLLILSSIFCVPDRARK